MAKIHSVEVLDDAISAEIAWRKQELTTALQIIRQSSGNARKANIRSGVLILYAHWEGWVKGVAQLYIRYVNTQRYSYDKLSEAFLGNALKTRMNAIGEASVPLVHNEFALFIRTGLTGRASLSESLVRTESNLSSSIFLDIIHRLGLERRAQYLLRAQMIDQELVHRRNTIAHGQYLELGLDEFQVLRTSTMELLEIFTDDVRNAASTGAHLAIPMDQE
ncbi:MAE_28990/MAE_18760 family HEPN-like nuclease [Nocardia sp. NPDC050799]|uniref:MAE_28990/MAE_18760 family HEPN-like nuclease n=1 Tax=Nocardia sp. NPDC050799 TaxID=3154842 RepID=UPI00340F65CB